MSTRSTTHFTQVGQKTPIAIIYRHSDGYPSGAGCDIHQFLDECAALSDSRFSDPSYLAAKYVVFLADMFNHGYAGDRKPSKLDFLSVGVTNADPGDIEYRYVIECGDGRPKVTCYAISGKYTQPPDGDWRKAKPVPPSKWIYTAIQIPAREETAH